MPQLNNNRKQGLDLVGLFFVVLSLVVTGLLAASRNAFTEPPAISFYFAWVHCAAVIFVWQMTVLKLRISYSLAILATVTTIALPCLAGNSAVLSWVTFLLLLLICAYGIIEILPSIRRASIWQGIAVLRGAPLIAAGTEYRAGH